MHELSIALNILDIVRETCQEENASSVVEVTLRIGDLSGVDTEALTTCLHIASRGSLMQHARISIIRQQGLGWCACCNSSFPMKDILAPCPVCLHSASEFLEGRELRLESILAE